MLFLLIPLGFIVAIVLYIGLFTGHTQEMLSPVNGNDDAVGLIAEGMRAVPADWRWEFGYAIHYGLEVRVYLGGRSFGGPLIMNDREIELTGGQVARLWDASCALRTGGGVKNNEALTKALAERIVKQYPPA